MYRKVRLVFIMCMITFAGGISLTAQEKTEGKCGEQVYWQYADGVLRIYGDGDMTSNPWMDDKALWTDTRKVVIEEGVTSICDFAFQTPVDKGWNANLSGGIEISSTVRCIGKWAFSYVDGLEAIQIPANVQQIGHGAFACCNDLKRVTFLPGSKMAKIEDGMFDGCRYLENVILPESVIHIGGYAFAECMSLQEIAIPDTVTTIGERVFLACYELKGIRLPDAVKVIPSKAFFDCYELVDVHISGNTTKIGANAFGFCSKMKQFTFPAKLEEIGKQAFLYCASLQELDLPDTVSKIGKCAFEGCAGAKSIHLPVKLKVIPEMMLYSCTGLKKIPIPATVTKIEKNAFGNCASLEKLVIPVKVSEIKPCHEDCPGLKEILNKSNVTYSLSASRLVMDWYQGGKKVTEVKPGKRVTSKGKRFRIKYSSEIMKKYKIRIKGKLPTSYVYGKEPKLPKTVKSDRENMLFMGWRYREEDRKYNTGPARTWYNARVTQFSRGLKGNICVFPMVDKIIMKKSSSKKAVMISKVQLKDYLTADCTDLRVLSGNPGPGILEFQVRYADNKEMKNATYLPLLEHKKIRQFSLKNLKKGKTYYVQYRSVPYRYFGVPFETCWGQKFKVRGK